MYRVTGLQTSVKNYDFNRVRVLVGEEDLKQETIQENINSAFTMVCYSTESQMNEMK